MNRRLVESSWRDLVLLLGVSPPMDMSARGLREWARPDHPHPSRLHRPLLFNLLNLALDGTLHTAASWNVWVDGKSTPLEAFREFGIMMRHQPDQGARKERERAIEWIKEHFPTAARQIHALDDSISDKVFDHASSYLATDLKMHNLAVQQWNLYQAEREKLDQAWLAVLEINPKDKDQHLELLDDYRNTVLVPIAKSVSVLEQSRETYSEHLREVISSAVMRSVGVPLTILSFPSLDDFEEALASIPRYDDTEKLTEYKLNCSVDLIQQRMNEYVELMNNRFGSTIKIDEEDMYNAVKKNQFNFQINQNFGGSMKAINSFAPENHFRDGE